MCPVAHAAFDISQAHLVIWENKGHYCSPGVRRRCAPCSPPAARSKSLLQGCRLGGEGPPARCGAPHIPRSSVRGEKGQKGHVGQSLCGFAGSGRIQGPARPVRAAQIHPHHGAKGGASGGVSRGAGRVGKHRGGCCFTVCRQSSSSQPRHLASGPALAWVKGKRRPGVALPLPFARPEGHGECDGDTGSTRRAVGAACSEVPEGTASPGVLGRPEAG